MNPLFTGTEVGYLVSTFAVIFRKWRDSPERSKANMTIPAELEAKILQLHKGDKWKIGTIARALNVHHEVVERVIKQDGVDKIRIIRTSIVDPYKGFIIEKLEEYPKLTAISLFRMVQSMGYKGGLTQLSDTVTRLRPKPRGEAYLRLKTLIGEEGQVDWAHFGKVQIGEAVRKLYAFVTVLSWSRMIFFRFCTGMDISYFLRGHKLAFDFFGGVPKRLLYDNLKSVVRERVGTTIQFNPVFLKLSGHYAFEPRACGVARGNEKGRVERAIRYIRTSFWEGRKWNSIDELNKQAQEWSIEIAGKRKCPENNGLNVMEAFKEEQGYLMQLPGTSFPTDERSEVKVRKQPYVRFDLNDYSVPHQYVKKQVTIFADEKRVRIIDGEKVIATHKRCYSKGMQIEDESHIEKLIAYKRRGRTNRKTDRLFNAVPFAEKLLKMLANKGEPLSRSIKAFIILLNEYNAEKLEKAMKVAFDAFSPHPNSVRIILEQWRSSEGKAPPIAVSLPNDARVKNLNVKNHSLQTYDPVIKNGESSDE